MYPLLVDVFPITSRADRLVVPEFLRSKCGGRNLGVPSPAFIAPCPFTPTGVYRFLEALLSVGASVFLLLGFELCLSVLLHIAPLRANGRGCQRYLLGSLFGIRSVSLPDRWRGGGRYESSPILICFRSAPRQFGELGNDVGLL